MRYRDIIEANQPAPGDPRSNPAFLRWFGQSKVVDATGRPLRCYHGTRAAFHTFSDEEAPGRGGLLAFFATDPKFASDYATNYRDAENVSPGANVMPVYLRIEQPFDFRKDWRTAGYFWDETGGIQDKWEANRILMGLGHQIDNIDDPSTPDLTEEEFTQAVKSGSWDALEAPEFVHYLRQDGCDGIVLLENGSVNYAIFEPSQVKSAISNRKFNPRRGNISEVAVPDAGGASTGRTTGRRSPAGA